MSRPLLAASHAYLAAPVVLFWFFYVPGWFGVVCGSGIVLWWIFLPRENAGPMAKPNPISSLAPLGIAVAASAMVLCAMGFPAGPWAWDWFKHWALIGTLTEQAWPIHTVLNGEQYSLRYYLAAYLVPALVAKHLLWLGYVGTTALWFGLGLTLLMLLIMQQRRAFIVDREFVRSNAWWETVIVLVVFVAMAGVDSLVDRLFRALTHEANPITGLHREWWYLDWFGSAIQLSGVLAMLTWVPHQAIPTMLLAVRFMRPQEDVFPWETTFGMALLALWSPMGLIGLIPVWLLHLYSSRRVWRDRGHLKRVGIGIVLMLPMVLGTVNYLSADLPAVTSTAFALGEIPERLSRMLFIAAIELGPCVLILGRRIWSDPLLRICLLVVLLLVGIADSKTPDFTMRVSIGPLMILMLSAAQSFSWQLRQRGYRGVLAAAGLMFALPTSIDEAIYHLSGGTYQDSLPESDRTYRLPFVRSENISTQQFLDICGWKYMPQYFMRRIPLVDGTEDSLR